MACSVLQNLALWRIPLGGLFPALKGKKDTVVTRLCNDVNKRGEAKLRKLRPCGRGKIEHQRMLMSHLGSSRIALLSFR